MHYEPRIFEHNGHSYEFRIISDGEFIKCKVFLDGNYISVLDSSVAVETQMDGKLSGVNPLEILVEEVKARIRASTGTFVGMLFLYYQDEDLEAHYEAEIVRAVLGPDRLAIEFKGHDREDGSYIGNCQLQRSGSRFSGPGNFRIKGKTVTATVTVSAEESAPDICLKGEWKDDGDRDSYQLLIDLQPATP